MILQNAAAFYLSTLAAGVIFLYFLRARSQRYDVSSLFLWEGLRNDAHSRAAWIRRRIDPLLILQLLALIFLIFALAEPTWRGLRPHLSGMAIVLDGSASMHTAAEANGTRYDLAREEGMSLLDYYPETPVTILQLSSVPRVLLPLTRDHETARRILVESEPTWYANGSSEQLQTLLESQGDSDTYEKIILLTDRSLDGIPVGVEQIRFEQGENVAITNFTVRENPTQEGVTALITIQNYTSSIQERTVVLHAGGRQISAQAVLPPGESNTYILPLFGSEGPVFSASIEPQDVFQTDDIRYFSFQKRLDKRVRWIGEENRYLLAALSAIQPIVLVPPEDTEPVDLTVAYDIQLSPDTVGNILLIHAGLEGVITIGEEREGESLASVKPGDPLLEELDVSNFRVLSSPRVDFPNENATVVLAYGADPFLLRINEQERDIILLASDLMKTNLPLTVDFPLLIRNIFAAFISPPSPVTTTWALAGELLDLSEYGVLTHIEAPNAESHAAMAPDSRSFTPETPGVYTVTTGKGIYTVAVNVDPSESIVSTPSVAEEEAPVSVNPKQASVLFPAWPYVAVMALLALIAEAILYHTGGVWRPRQK
jgi:hypothetical protein